MKWNIGSKLGVLIAFVVANFLILGILSYLMIGNLMTSMEWHNHTHQVLQMNEVLRSHLKDAETGQRGYIITGEEKYLEPYYKALEKIHNELQTLTEITRDDQNQQKRLESAKELIEKKLAILKETIELRKEKGFDAARDMVITDIGKNIMDEYRDLAKAFENEENELMDAREKTLNNNARYTKWLILFGTLFAILIVSIVGFFLVRNISVPLRTVTGIANRIAQGELNVEIGKLKRQDEVGQLNQAFDRMVKMLRKSISEIVEGVNTLGSSSSEILAATTQVASGAAETSSAISETTSTVEEVRQAAQLSSQKAGNVAENAQQVAQVASSGQLAVEESIAGILDIQKQMESIANTIVRLSEQSQQIGGIIASVTDVADQSNLLAVNAAIEAAKAGEQGKGFAVVAQEIKSLAQQSKQATIQVRNILIDVQKATSAAVMATEQGSKAVDTGVKQSGKAGEAIRTLSQSIKESLQVATQIVASSQQQVIGMDQVGLAMNNINQAGAENAASMSQAEKAAGDLNELGQQLKKLVEQYKL